MGPLSGLTDLSSLSGIGARCIVHPGASTRFRHLRTPAPTNGGDHGGKLGDHAFWRLGCCLSATATHPAGSPAMNTLATAIRDTKAGDLVAVTHTDGTVFVEPVVERRRGGLRFSVRSGFGAQDLFIPFGNIAAIKALS